MGDNPLEVEHLWLKGLEPEMKGSTLESLRFHQLQELASQGQQVPDESTSAQPLSDVGKANCPVTCSYEETKTRKKPKLADENHASPSIVPPFSPETELSGRTYRHILQSLDLHSQCSLNMAQFRRTSGSPSAVHSIPHVSPCTPVRSGEDLLESSSRSKLMGFCYSNGRDCTAVGASSRITVLYAELIRELELQVVELRRLLVSREEAAAQQEKRIQELEAENSELKGLLHNLEEQNDFLSVRNEAGGIAPAKVVLRTHHNSLDVNESNIQFLKGLMRMLENNGVVQVDGLHSPSVSEAQSHITVTTPNTSPGWRTHYVSSWVNAEDGSGNPIVLNGFTGLWDNNGQEMLIDEIPVWASPVEENGRLKLELVSSSRVYITHHQLEDLSQVSTDKPELMTRRLLDYFFSRETLARSSATGQRIAHNNMTMEKPIPLPAAVVNAIKEYVIKTCGRGCNFNSVINSKCGTSRRAVKKMTVSDHQNAVNGATTETFQEPLKG